LSNVYKSVEVVVDHEKYVMHDNAVKTIGSEGAASSSDGSAHETYTVDNSVQKKMIIHHARKTAEDIIEDAVERSNTMYRDGYSKGLDEGEKQYVGYLEQARQVLEQAHNEKEKIYKDYENEIISLSVEIAEKIIGSHLEENPALLHDIFISAVNKSIHETNGPVKVRMSIDNINNLMSGDELKHMKAEFHPDKSLRDDECIIETENGTADACIGNQINQVKKSFKLIDEE